MPRYRYTDVWPHIFSGLSHGPDTVVTRHDPAAAADVPGSTVVLLPGDEITTTQPVTSAFLAELPDPAPTPAPTPPAAPQPPADPATAVPTPTTEEPAK